MKQQDPLSLARLGAAGMSVISTLIVGFVLGLLAHKLLHWDWAVPLGIVLGFAAGIVSMFRQLGSRA